MDENQQGGLAERPVEDTESARQNGEDGASPDKGWMAVVTDGCDECGFSPDFDVQTTGKRVRATIPKWEAVLDRLDAPRRPAPDVWSPLEYACHVRDINALYRGRLDLMLAQDDPTFPNWDPDTVAVDSRYGEDEPQGVAEAYRREATQTADQWDAVRDDEWGRRGLRDNGSTFTVATLAVYFLHDLEHHLKDVSA
ncbi:DinB family protein [Dermacoccus sp. PE3]|uniref:DinB family protein n=1 Tax=Dermacoccus sp. PE3 TaxID=1641401 RepID=UPI0009E4E8CF|nr:DinB family protein [Dermacoccus sp. PE3]